jgi:chromosome segregation ATPase
MKQFMVNLLVAVALGLCGLCTYQWYREAGLRNKLEDLSRDIYKRKETIVDLEGRLERSEADRFRLDKAHVELTAMIRTNAAELASVQKRLDQSEKLADQQKQAAESYKEALETANGNVKTANAEIVRQNEILKQFVDERKTLVDKYNTVVKQYEDLVKQFKDYEAEVKKAMEAQKKN